MVVSKLKDGLVQFYELSFFLYSYVYKHMTQLTGTRLQRRSSPLVLTEMSAVQCSWSLLIVSLSTKQLH